jgi:hypothetical protein
MVPFEMRSSLYGICLLSDVGHKHGWYIYMKQKEEEKEQDAGETERDSVLEREGGSERGRVAARRGSVSRKND